MLTDGKILELFDATGGGIVGRLSRFARAIEAEVLQTQEPAGEIIMYAPYGKLSAPFARPEWRGGALPPVGTKLYTAPQPPAPCQNSTDMEYYRAECEKLQAKVAILDGLSQVAIDGGWTYRGMEAYAKGLEDKVAELEKAYKDKDDAATQLVAAMRDMAGKIKEQRAEIERLNRGMTVYTEAFEAECRTTDAQAALIERVKAYENWQKVTVERDALALQNKALEKEVEKWGADFIRISDNYSEEAKMNMDFGAERLAFILKEQKQAALIEQCEKALRSCDNTGFDDSGHPAMRQNYDREKVKEALAAIAKHKQ